MNIINIGSGWNDVNILDRNGANPGLHSDYSLLGKADYIKDQSTADHFEVEFYDLKS